MPVFLQNADRRQVELESNQSAAGTLDLLILRALRAGGELHGLAVSRRIEQMTR